jgi:hypothetical protein
MLIERIRVPLDQEMVTVREIASGDFALSLEETDQRRNRRIVQIVSAFQKGLQDFSASRLRCITRSLARRPIIGGLSLRGFSLSGPSADGEAVREATLGRGPVGRQ